MALQHKRSTSDEGKTRPDSIFGDRAFDTLETAPPTQATGGLTLERDVGPRVGMMEQTLVCRDSIPKCGRKTL